MVCIPKQILCGGAHAQGLSSVMPLSIGRDVLQRATHHTSSPAKKSENLFSIFSGIKEYHAVGLSERSPNPPSDPSLSKHVAGDPGFRFSARDGEARRSGAMRP